MNTRPISITRHVVLACLMPMLLIFVEPAQPQDGQGLSQGTTDTSVVQVLERAAAHHDLAILYLRKSEPEKAAAEARQILLLKIPSDQEHLVVKSLAIISDKLGEIRRFDLAQALLDEALKACELGGNKARVLKTKARLYLLADDNDKAIESYKRALELEPRPVR